MPFATTQQLPPNPFVRIFFVGLNILAPTEENTCQTFVHNQSDDHHLLIEVRRKRRGKPDLLIMRRPGPLDFFEDDHGLLILTDGLPAGEKGVKAYDGREPSTEGTKLFDSFTLTEILDVSPGEVDRDGGLPSIFIDHGIFYTADKQTRKARFVKTKGGNVKTRRETPTIIGANIYPPASLVKLFWRQDERDRHLLLDPDFTHEVYVINEPLFDDESPSSPKHDEFEEYFKILPDVDEDEHYRLELEERPDKGTTRNPCMSLLLSE